jgi:hypothetical protein
MPIPAEKSKTVFDIEIPTLLENLRAKLVLSSKWRRTARKESVAFYQNGNYWLAIRINHESGKPEQLAVEAASEQTDDVQSFFKLSDAVMSEVDPGLEPDERKAILEKDVFGSLPISPAQYSQEKTVNGISYRCLLVRNEGLVFSAQKSSE